MLHTKFQGHRSIGSGEDFLRFLPYMGMAAMLVMWPRPFEQLFFPKGPGGCIWNLVAIGPVVSEEKSFEIVDGRRTTCDGRTTDNGACLYYKLPRSLRLRWAKKRISFKESTTKLSDKQKSLSYLDYLQAVQSFYSSNRDLYSRTLVFFFSRK